MRKVFAVVLASLLLGAWTFAYAAPQDTWKIVSPAPGANVTGPDVTLQLDPGEIKVVAPGPVVAGEGHWHFFADGAEVGKGPANTFTFKGLSPGTHILKVELHQGDHTLYPSGGERTVTVNVVLPNTGGSVIPYLIGGLLLLAAGLLLFRRSAPGVR